MKKIFFISSLFVITILLFTACNKKDEKTTDDLISFEEFLQSQTNLSTFSQALDKAQLQSFKKGTGPYTWFAPTNAAFQAAGISVDQLTASQLSYILLYHMIPTTTSPVLPIYTKEMHGKSSFARTTQMGSAVYLGQLNDSFYVNGSNIISADNKVSNGVVHIINRLNLPPNLRGNIQTILTSTGQHTLFIAALTRANRWTALSSSIFTVLAPTDAAMAAAGYTTTSINAAPVSRIDSVVRYHLFSGSRLFTNDFGNSTTPATFLASTKTLQASNNGTKVKGTQNSTPVDIVIPNLLGTNGVVHIINGVLRY